MHPKPAVFHVGTSVYAERADGTILLLKRAAEGTWAGQWYLPGGAVDDGELPSQGAARELFEEAGLRPTSDLALIGVFELPGEHPALMISYACSVDDTEPVISHEHTGARWIRPEQLRDALLDATGFLGDIRDDAQRYIEWRARR